MTSALFGHTPEQLMIALANLSVEHKRVVEERDAALREADTLAETLRITQARCTELVEELRAERNKSFKQIDLLVTGRGGGGGGNDGRQYNYHPTNCLCAACC